MADLPPLPPAVASSIASWHNMLASRDLSGLSAITHPDVVFRSPVAHSPYHSAQALSLALSNVIEVFTNFTYHRQAATADGMSVVLEFSATIDDKDIKGIDFIRFNEEGKIIEFEVMLRPLSGAQALAAAMGKRVASTLPLYKSKT